MLLSKLKHQLQLNDIITVIIRDHWSGYHHSIFPSYISIIGRIIEKFSIGLLIEVWDAFYFDENRIEEIPRYEHEIINVNYYILSNTITYLEIFDYI